MKTVLFVGFTNVGTTQMCEAFLDHMAREKGLAVQAESAGLKPRWEIDPAVATAMGEVGIPMDHYTPKLLMHWHVANADRVILMHRRTDPEHVPDDLKDHEDWGLPDVAGQPVETVRRVRDLVREKVAALLAEEAA